MPGELKNAGDNYDFYLANILFSIDFFFSAVESFAYFLSKEKGKMFACKLQQKFKAGKLYRTGTLTITICQVRVRILIELITVKPLLTPMRKLAGPTIDQDLEKMINNKE